MHGSRLVLWKRQTSKPEQIMIQDLLTGLLTTTSRLNCARMWLHQVKGKRGARSSVSGKYVQSTTGRYWALCIQTGTESHPRLPFPSPLPSYLTPLVPSFQFDTVAITFVELLLLSKRRDHVPQAGAILFSYTLYRLHCWYQQHQQVKAFPGLYVSVQVWS